MSLKKALYPSEEIEIFLETVPKGQLSSRINELILKGLTLERQLKIQQDYKKYNEILAQKKTRGKNKGDVSSTMMMSAKAFEPEDETEDFF